MRLTFCLVSTWSCTAALTLFSSCVDPFAVDKRPVTAGASGGATTFATGGAIGSGGAPIFTGGGGGTGAMDAGAGTTTDAHDPVGTGGTIGSGGASASGGAGSLASGGAGSGGGTGGRPGTGGSINPDAGVPGSGGAAGGRDGGMADGPTGTGGMPEVIQACTPDPAVADGGAVTCPANLREIANWFPVTPPVQGCNPAPHPATECRFYQFSWQQFLIATQPDAQGRPAFLSWNTIENTFGAGAGQPTPAIPYFGAGVTQAGGRQVVIDGNGHALYYGMHMNPAFVNFVRANALTTANGILNVSPDLAFPTTQGIVELKEAWQIVPDNAPPANFITTTAMVPTLRVDSATKQIVVDEINRRMVTLALVAIHVVHTVPGHPEFVWASFQHVVAATGLSDVAPSAPDNPGVVPLGTVLSPIDHLLYRANTTAANANRGVLTPQLNEATQTFITPPTSIYRLFPGSKSQTAAFDDDVASINDVMTARFAQAPRPAANDKRPNYRLVGAIWQDRPDLTFKVNKILVNDETDPDIIVNGADSLHSITGGEDRMSSTAMESFTQPAASFPNCFSCHDTQATTARGVPLPRDLASPMVMKPGRINVSHIFNEVVRLNLN